MDSSRPNKNYLAIDYGKRRVGIAGCVGEVKIAFGITTIIINGMPDLLQQLQPILDKRNISDVVLGFPITLGDKPGSLKSEILELANLLQERNYVVHLVDEAMSSEKASQKLRERGKSSPKASIDRAAAALFLQEFIDGELIEYSIEEILKKSNNY